MEKITPIKHLTETEKVKYEEIYKLLPDIKEIKGYGTTVNGHSLWRTHTNMPLSNMTVEIICPDNAFALNNKIKKNPLYLKDNEIDVILLMSNEDYNHYTLKQNGVDLLTASLDNLTHAKELIAQVEDRLNVPKLYRDNRTGELVHPSDIN